MKKLSHDVERVGSSTKVQAQWRTRMRTPGAVEITKDQPSTMKTTTLIEGDSAEVFDTLSGIAEIAWSMGWRPAGLETVVSAVVKSYKIPEG